MNKLNAGKDLIMCGQYDTKLTAKGIHDAKSIADFEQFKKELKKL